MSNTNASKAESSQPGPSMGEARADAGAMILSLTPDRLRTLMQERGYRVELLDGPQAFPVLRSATNGLGFEVRFLNRLADGASYADVTFLAALQVQGKLPLEPVNDWNNGRRFARLHLQGDHLILDMDVSALGGVSENYLRTQIEIWDRLIEELIPYLREALRALAKPNGADPGVGLAAPEQAATGAGATA